MNLRKCRKSYDDTCECPNCKNFVMNKELKVDVLEILGKKMTTRDWKADELITLIRTATLDEVNEVLRKYGIEYEALYKLRGNDD